MATKTDIRPMRFVGGLTITRNNLACWVAVVAAAIGSYGNGVGVADLLLLVAVVLAWPGVNRRAAVIWILIIAGPAALSAAWSNVPDQTLHLSARVAGIIFVANQRRWTIHASPAILLLAALAVSAVMEFGTRGGGLSNNAVTLGESGLILLMTGTVPGAIAGIPMLSMVATRSPIAAAAIFAVLVRNRWVFLAVLYAGALWMISAESGGHLHRVVNPGYITYSFNDRIDASVPGRGGVGFWMSEQIAQRAIDEGVVDSIETPRLHLFGYGIGAFNEKTGQQRPHSVVSLLAHELGILSIITIAGVLVAMAWKLPWPHALVLLVLFTTVSDTPAGAPVGMFTAMLLILFAKQKHFGMGFQSAWTVFKTTFQNVRIRLTDRHELARSADR